MELDTPEESLGTTVVPFKMHEEFSTKYSPSMIKSKISLSSLVPTAKEMPLIEGCPTTVREMGDRERDDPSANTKEIRISSLFVREEVIGHVTFVGKTLDGMNRIKSFPSSISQ